MSDLNKEDAYDKIVSTTIDQELDDFETDKDGQLILKTGVYRWSNGNYYDQPEKLGMN